MGGSEWTRRIAYSRGHDESGMKLSNRSAAKNECTRRGGEGEEERKAYMFGSEMPSTTAQQHNTARDQNPIPFDEGHRKKAADRRRTEC